MKGERLGTMCYESFKGIQKRTNQNEGEKIYILSIKDLKNGKIKFNELNEESISIPITKKDQYLREGDLIITLRGTSFKAAVFEKTSFDPQYPDHTEKIYLDENLACLRLNFGNAKLIAAYLNSPPGQQYLEQMSTGTRVKSLSINSLHNMRIPLPPWEVQEELTRFVNSVDQFTRQIEEEKQTINRVLNSVLENYMGGY